MEQFQVSARKYRPQQFEAVVGQSHITDTLKNAILSNQLAQAFLFCGPRGVGKTTCARILAKVINAPDPVVAVKDGSYASADIDVALNIFELDAASNNSVDDIRNLVEQVRFAPQAGKYKVYIIDEVHMLSTQAFNAFLKTLEEPPPYAIFILATTEKHKILPTILSRCQIFNFRQIGIGDIVNHLKEICEKEDITAEEAALHLIAQKADGALRDALSIFDQIASFSNKNIVYEKVLDSLNILDYEYYFQVTDALLSQDDNEAMVLFDTIIKQGFDGAIFLDGLSKHFRDLLFAQSTRTTDLLEYGEQIKARYANQATIAPKGFLLTGLNLLNETGIQYKGSQSKRLLIELALLKLAHLPSLMKLERLTVSVPEKKNSGVTTNQQSPANKAEATTTPEVKEAVSPKTQEPKIKETVAPKMQAQAPEPKVTAPKPPKSEPKIVNVRDIPTDDPPLPKKQVIKTEVTPIPQAEISEAEHATAIKIPISEVTPANFGRSLMSLDQITAEEAAKVSKIYDTPAEAGLTQATLEEEWDAFGESTESRRVIEAFKKFRPTIEGHEIKTTVPNAMTEAVFQTLGSKFILMLHQKYGLQNLNLLVSHIPDKSSKSDKPLTSQEKLNKMVEAYPSVGELIKKFELEVIY